MDLKQNNFVCSVTLLWVLIERFWAINTVIPSNCEPVSVHPYVIWSLIPSSADHNTDWQNVLHNHQQGVLHGCVVSSLLYSVYPMTVCPDVSPMPLNLPNATTNVGRVSGNNESMCRREIKIPNGARATIFLSTLARPRSWFLPSVGMLRFH